MNAFRIGSAADATRTVGILSRVAPAMLLDELPRRIPSWPLSQQEIAIRQIVASGGAGSGALLLAVLPAVDIALRPLVIDEIGFAGDEQAADELLRIASIEDDAGAYARVKAIEALARMKSSNAIPLLRDLIMARKTFGWRYADELRISALHALERINPHLAGDPSIAGSFKAQPASALCSVAGSEWTRHRRYERVVPDHVVNAVASTRSGVANISIEKLSLGGGLAQRHSHDQLGAEGVIELGVGFRRLRARVLIQEIGAGRLIFEILDMSLEDRWRLRRLLAEAAHAATPETSTPPAAVQATVAVPQFTDDPRYWQ